MGKGATKIFKNTTLNKLVGYLINNTTWQKCKFKTVGEYVFRWCELVEELDVQKSRDTDYCITSLFIDKNFKVVVKDIFFYSGCRLGKSFFLLSLLQICSLSKRKCLGKLRVLSYFLFIVQTMRKFFTITIRQKEHKSSNKSFSKYIKAVT